MIDWKIDSWRKFPIKQVPEYSDMARVNSVEHELWQEGTGSHYNHTYFYGTTSGSETNILQKGDANHNSQIRLQGSQPTTLNIIQQGNTNQSYTLTQNCHTSGGCTVNVTQGN